MCCFLFVIVCSLSPAFCCRSVAISRWCLKVVLCFECGFRFRKFFVSLRLHVVVHGGIKGGEWTEVLGVRAESGRGRSTSPTAKYLLAVGRYYSVRVESAENGRCGCGLVFSVLPRARRESCWLPRNAFRISPAAVLLELAQLTDYQCIFRHPNWSRILVVYG